MTTITKHELFNKLGQFQRGHKIANNLYRQEYAGGYALQSYSTLVAVKLNGSPVWYFTGAHDYSVTTCKHCTQFTGHATAERRQMLKDGDAVWIEG